LILILESEVIEESLKEKREKRPLTVEQDNNTNSNGLNSLEDVKKLLLEKFYPQYCTDEILVKTSTIVDPIAAWTKLINLSNSKNYLAFNNWMLERLFTQRQLNKLGSFNEEVFIRVVENALVNDNLDFLEMLFKYSQNSFTANEDTKTLYFKCSKLMESHMNRKNEKKVEKIINILYNSKLFV